MKALIGVLALLSSSPAFAAHPFHVEDMQELSRVSGPKVSPDGKWVAFTVTRSDVAKNKSVTPGIDVSVVQHGFTEVSWLLFECTWIEV